MNQSFYTGALGAGSCIKKLSVTANNLANVNTTGFKPKTVVFSDLLNVNLNDSEEAVTDLQTGVGVRVESTQTGFGISGAEQTQSEYDYAIMEPNAFFMLKDPETGAVSYTRNGHFHRAYMEDGFYLVSESGKLVLDQNKEPIALDTVDVEKRLAEMDEDYDVEDYEEDDEDEGEEEKSRVGIYTFQNPSRLLSSGDQEYVLRDGTEEAKLIENPNLANGALETSGTDIAKEMTRIIECQRAFSYALRMVTTSDEIESTINSLRG